MHQLDLMLDDMAKADPLFCPTHFWQTCLGDIVTELRQKGIESFRSHETAIDLYAATYGKKNALTIAENFQRQYRYSLTLDPTFSSMSEEEFAFHKNLADHFCGGVLRGGAEARLHYSSFKAADTPIAPLLNAISESDIGEPPESFVFDKKNYSRTMLNYLRALAFLKKTVDTSCIKRVFEIGGGYGTLGEIFLKAGPSFYLNIDIPPVAAVSTYYLQSVFGKDAVLTYEQSRTKSQLDIDTLSQTYRAAVICPWQLPTLKGSFELFANFHSFQEMEPAVVENYAAYIKRHCTHYLLLKNAKYGKTQAQEPGERLTVLKKTTHRHYESLFAPFMCQACDSFLFGDESRHFTSEVSIFSL